jgi:DNA-binding response OmpR family regulator
MATVLVVEDEQHLADGLRFNLEAEGYDVEVAYDGETALVLLLGRQSEFDLVLLDVMLPGKDGFDVASELRAADQFVPILMLTARGRPQDVLRGFESGADDYLPKPFELAILLARLRGLLRRRKWFGLDAATSPTSASETNSEQTRLANGSNEGNKLSVFTFEGKTIDFAALELRVEDRTIHLTVMEAELLRHLVQHAGQIVSRKAMLEEVWGVHEDTDTRAIDNFIVRLRKYIEVNPAKPRYLITVRSVGYKFIPSPTD